MPDPRIDDTRTLGAAAGADGGPAIDRAFGRRLFREMIKLQIDDAPTTWRDRRRLVRFARRLGIDAFEAKLLIRATEYELGLVEPAALDARQTAAETRYIARDNATSRASLLLPVGVIAGLLIAWLLTAKF